MPRFFAPFGAAETGRRGGLDAHCSPRPLLRPATRSVARHLRNPGRGLVVGPIRGAPPRLTHAQALAAKIITTRRPFCERVEVAGSIRRGKPEVKDIEICAIPNHYFAEGKLLDRDGRVIATPEESDVYAALGLRYLEPEARR